MRRTLALVALLALYLFVALQNQDGWWDSWAHWNGRARLLLYHDPLWLFQVMPPNHLDYPPLWYLIVNTGYRLAGDTPLVGVVLHGAVFAALLLFYRRALIVIFVGLVTLEYAVSQFADIPLALTFLLAAVAYRHKHEDYAGLALGAGVLIKNEGLLIALIFVGVWIVRERRIPRAALVTLLPCFVGLWIFRQFVQAPGDLFTSGAGARLFDISRYIIVLPLTVAGLVQFGIGALPLLGGVMVAERRTVRTSVPLLAAGVVLLGYVGIYLISPYDLTWHITNSWDRLIVQVFPVLVYETIN
jgi:hypothetical protein